MTADQAYFLGADGGGSGCRAAIADADGQIVGNGTAGSANATTDANKAAANVMKAVREAIADAGLTEDILTNTQAHVGLAGIMNEAQASDFSRKLSFEATVSDDRPTSLIGALGKGDGVLAAVGTGSLLGVSTMGQMRFIGGWGLRVGDQASGAWLGRGLLEQVLLANDGLLDASPLIDAVFSTFDRDPNNVVAFAHDAEPKAFAKLAPQIVAASKTGDPTGTALMTKGAAYLEQAFAILDPSGTLPVCLVGGLGQAYEHWLSAPVVDRLVPPKGTALDGALLLARDAT